MIEKDFQKNLQLIKNQFNEYIAKYVEKIYRLETNHLKSGQFKQTYSAGMEAFSEQYPYGWKTMHQIFWSKYPEYKPTGFITMKENQTGLTKKFLKFPNLLAAMLTLAKYIEYYNNPARWYSTDAEAQKSYMKKLDNIKTLYV